MPIDLGDLVDRALGHQTDDPPPRSVGGTRPQEADPCNAAEDTPAHLRHLEASHDLVAAPVAGIPLLDTLAAHLRTDVGDAAAFPVILTTSAAGQEEIVGPEMMNHNLDGGTVPQHPRCLAVLASLPIRKANRCLGEMARWVHPERWQRRAAIFRSN